MADINQWTMSGVVLSQPRTAQSQGGGTYTTLEFSVCRFDGRTRQEVWEEHRIAVLSPDAAAEAARLREGQRVVLGGRLASRVRRSKDGQREFRETELAVTSVVPGAMYAAPDFTVRPQQAPQQTARQAPQQTARQAPPAPPPSGGWTDAPPPVGGAGRSWT